MTSGRLVEAEGDPLRIQQIVVNLLNNSIQSRQSDRPICIRIELRERNFVFERFFRGESKKQTVRGLGLGLAFSRLLAQAQGGELVLLESSEEGSSFTLTLPTAFSPPD
ncbi:ATP-binding protein [Paenibacillus alkaliterrae]|uniref:ATP-binding protein n=1 Tax=Paenibacillus alkaliterrae TaxID=320909 RepID=UPI001F3D37B2|nr:ATP-binding protein [Paenibacillus alkaliterrae]MCF2941025.1 ATP-binding protein [Paenibacillus alkaliterrae]